MSPLESSIHQALKEVYDPEIPINVVDLGLIYEIRECADMKIYIKMTVTAPHCPAANFLPEQVRQVAQAVTGVGEVEVELVMEPGWQKHNLSPEARKILGYR